MASKDKKTKESRRSRERRLRYHRQYNRGAYQKFCEKECARLMEMHNKAMRRM